MAKASLVQKGDTIDYKATADIAYLDVITLTTRIGVALEAIAAGETGSVAVSEVWEMPAVANSAFEVGAQLYWNVTNGQLTKTATDNIPAGWATEAKAASGTTARVKIG